jgi:hypothetical protein
MKGFVEMEISHEGRNHMDSIKGERVGCASPKRHGVKREEA